MPVFVSGLSAILAPLPAPVVLRIGLILPLGLVFFALGLWAVSVVSRATHIARHAT